MVKVSIVIPVYNVLEYIDLCIQSVFKQTVSDYEVILVDDGSTDGSKLKCDEYARKDHRVRVIHKSNGGLASAVKVGVKEARGEYLYFLDSDDELGAEGLEILLMVQAKYHLDLVCAACTSERDKVMTRQVGYSTRLIGHETIMQSVISNGKLSQKIIENSRCGKLFRRDAVIQYIEYYNDAIKKGEDQMMTLPLLLTAKQVVYVEGLYPYYYRIRESSICQKYKPTLWNAILQQHEQIKYIVSELSDRDIDTQLNNSIVSSSLSTISTLQRSSESFFGMRSVIKSVLDTPELRKAFLHCRFTENKINKLLLFLAKYRAVTVLSMMQCRNRAKGRKETKTRNDT